MQRKTAASRPVEPISMDIAGLDGYALPVYPLEENCMPIRRLTFVLAALTWLTNPLPAHAFQVRAGIGFVAVTDAAPGAELRLLQAQGAREIARGTTDTFGSLIFRDLNQGARYVVTDRPHGRGGSGGPSVQVLEFTDHPDTSFYQQ